MDKPVDDIDSKYAYSLLLSKLFHTKYNVNKMSKKAELKQIIDRMNEADIESVIIVYNNKVDVKIDKEKEMSGFLFEFFNNKVVKITGEKEMTYYNDKGEWVYQQDYINNKIWVSYDICWSVLKSKYNLNYQEIKTFISGWIETNLGWQGLTPMSGVMIKIGMIETNLGWQGLTPTAGNCYQLREVETNLDWNGLSPHS